MHAVAAGGVWLRFEIRAGDCAQSERRPCDDCGNRLPERELWRTKTLADGAVYNYRFKILGSGPTKVLWTDAERNSMRSLDPNLEEGQQGTLTVTLTQRWRELGHTACPLSSASVPMAHALLCAAGR